MPDSDEYPGFGATCDGVRLAVVYSYAEYVHPRQPAEKMVETWLNRHHDECRHRHTVVVEYGYKCADLNTEYEYAPIPPKPVTYTIRCGATSTWLPDLDGDPLDFPNDGASIDYLRTDHSHCVYDHEITGWDHETNGSDEGKPRFHSFRKIRREVRQPTP